MTVPVLVYTCNEYRWCLKPFLYLMGVYWSREQPVIIGGCEPFDAGPSVHWLKVPSRVKERWSDGLIECLERIDQSHVVWMLEDYWLCRTVDVRVVASLAAYAEMHPNVLKIDLTGDRLYSGHAADVDYWGHCDIIETPWDTPYQWSTQTAIWNREHLLNSLRPEMSPWDFELRSDKAEGLRVLGTRQWPVRYINGVGMGLEAKYKYRTEHIRDGLGGRTIERLDAVHLGRMVDLHLLPEQVA